MKTIQPMIKKVAMVSLLLFALFGINSCKKSSTDPNALSGDTNIPLTQVNSVTNLYLSVNGVNTTNTTMTVLKNDNGMVTYGLSVDLTTYPDSILTTVASLVPQLIQYYNPKDVTWSITPGGTLNIQFKLKITSDGIQNNFVDGQPWTLRYADAVGTTNTVTRTNGQKLGATVTESTGVDEWPYSYYLIKTSKIEYNAPADDPQLNKVTLRVNHKFGLVYVKAEGKNGKVLELNLIAFFML